jgi:hypothetical protein
MIRKKIWMVEMVNKNNGNYEENYYLHSWSQIGIIQKYTNDDLEEDLVVGTGYNFVYFPTTSDASTVSKR